MIIDALKVQDVVEGRKTVEVKRYGKPEPPKWATVGKVVPVQVVTERPTLVRGYEVMRRRPGQAICHVRILAARVCDLDDVTEKEARAAGFRSEHAFLDDWNKRHEVPQRGSERVLVVSFERAERDQRARFMRPTGKGGDYTSVQRLRGRQLAMTNEPAAVSAEDQHEITSDAARAAREAHVDAQRERERLDMERRLNDAILAAELKRIDLTDELRYLRRLRPQQKDATLRQIRTIEDRVHRHRNAA